MKEELNELKKIIKIKKKEKIYELIFYFGEIDNKSCILVESGVGKVNASRTAQVLIDKIGVDYIFNIGVAGGLTENLKVLDIVIGEKLVQHDFDITAFNHPKGYIPNIGIFVNSDKDLVSTASKCIPEGIIGTIASGDIFCNSIDISQKIKKDFNTLCVEMEGASIAQVCFLCNIPFLVIRCISDIIGKDNLISYEKFLKDSSKKIATAMKEIILKM